ncbi:uncharacterized protein C8Q71DRAFT_280728 [Rhodofomes roseus]|uniref:Uncharacterized protein n=1 Tax=Rhodofomes roseus TaxID=34475 RepID=A0ABQ8K569_9APHY|nr:uncharacterized protein C8Q71DRAFT_280621 [Rhodofomes roseus]XP_047775127.1 uncharacterized protein C8Q71DRAFT_280728 [Rhodofomes roseus]KAH9832078.1 hypothetical protein C8Q71DRAFT_280621 [Rhodofomes roseus]KAH9832081.1 hypothetical protein C8Q71DRAFT_280728 [Rhodofomes roseus]
MDDTQSLHSDHSAALIPSPPSYTLAAHTIVFTPSSNAANPRGARRLLESPTIARRTTRRRSAATRVRWRRRNAYPGKRCLVHRRSCGATLRGRERAEPFVAGTASSPRLMGAEHDVLDSDRCASAGGTTSRAAATHNRRLEGLVDAVGPEVGATAGEPSASCARRCWARENIAWTRAIQHVSRAIDVSASGGEFTSVRCTRDTPYCAVPATAIGSTIEQRPPHRETGQRHLPRRSSDDVASTRARASDACVSAKLQKRSPCTVNWTVSLLPGMHGSVGQR